MDYANIFFDSKWKILKELGKGPKSATEIYKKTNQTLANTTIQLKKLEEAGLVKKSLAEQKTQKAKKGKPKKNFELSGDTIIIGLLSPSLCEKKIHFTKENAIGSGFEKFITTSLLLLNEEQAYALSAFCLQTNMLKKSEVIGLLKAEGNEIELFIVSDSHLQEIRDHHSNAHIEVPTGKTKKIISWSHSSKEVVEGISRGEGHFLNLIKAKQLLDKNDLLRMWGK